MTTVSRNRLGNVQNRFQGSDVKILTVCSAGLLRSPTLARLLHRKFKNVNCRPVGLNNEYALVPLDPVHLYWADVVLVMESWMFQEIEEMIEKAGYGWERELHCLNVPDDYGFGDPELEELLIEKMEHLFEELKQLRETDEDPPETYLLDLERF